ncbi:uncharacterized protein TNCV_222821 [Trichonephila clavipes]|nr:uncharacterized protein TNCV_222821 [Trichonephila clavipes]
MDVCKCLVPLRLGDTLNSRRVACPYVWLVEGKERWEAPDHPQGLFLRNWSGTEQNRTVTCIMLKAKCGVTGDEFADHLEKKGASIQQITRKAVPFTSARRIIKKKLNDLSLRRYTERYSNKMWWNNLKDLLKWLRRKTVEEIRLTTGLGCLLQHLHRIHVAQGPFLPALRFLGGHGC